MVVIVGGTSGIGLATANYLMEQGYNVLVCGRTKPKQDNIHFQALDVTSNESIKEFFSSLETIDGLIYSVGITMPKQEITAFNPIKFHEIMDVNVTGLLLCLKYSYENLKKNRGRVVVVNSVASRKGSALSGIEYTTSKAALSGVVKQLALDFAKDEVLINSIFPSMTATPMLLESIDSTELQGIKNSIPLQRIAEPLEIAKAIEFLISERNSYMTGAGLDVNGGLFLNG
ncbi:SDR family oxidoreductase [bacterium]|nr:SDR family oxidoreductase [bacterium]MBU1433502.1 SDR family oxidoreductase [bacterium]MBU1503316.1 SDR family oxidoreductase [bacterium]